MYYLTVDYLIPFHIQKKMKSPKKRFRDAFRRSSLYIEYFEYFEIQKNQNIFVLAKLFEYFEYFEIQKNQNIQNILKSPKTRFRETFGRSSLYFEYFEFFEIQKIQNIFVLANFFEYFEYFEIQKNQNIFVLANFFEFFEYFEIQKIQNILKSPKTRFR